MSDWALISQNPYAIKNQRKARNTPRGHFVPKPLVGGFGCLELVLYGIRVLAKQFLESNIDIGWRKLILPSICKTLKNASNYAVTGSQQAKFVVI